MSSVHAASKPGDIFCFDFDGVVVDSCDECTESALRTLRTLFPTMKWPASPAPPALATEMRTLRPYIETGWEIPVMLRLRHEASEGDDSIPTVASLLSGDAPLRETVDKSLSRWGVSSGDFVGALCAADFERFFCLRRVHLFPAPSAASVRDLFSRICSGAARDDWMAEDLHSWLQINPFYGGVPEALTACAGSAHVITTKQKRFAVALVRHAGVGADAVPDACIYGLGEYKSKADVIARLLDEAGPGTTAHFFEDRWPTLVKCAADPRLDGRAKLYLCDWGYVQAAELEAARAEPKVEIISR